MLLFTMNEFNDILTKLKKIIGNINTSTAKVRDKDVAAVLNIKESVLASYKSRDKPPYQAILTYCHNNRLDVRKILFNGDDFNIDYPKQTPIGNAKVSVKYFRTLDDYGRYLSLQ